MTLQEGVGLVRQLSPEFSFHLDKDETRTFRMHIDNLLLAKGEFVFSVALFKTYDPDDTSTAVRYDLLSRSFKLTVNPKMRSEPAYLHHPANWEQLEDSDQMLLGRTRQVAQAK